MKPERIPDGILKHPAWRYLHIDIGEGEDYEYGYHKQEIVRIAKPRTCLRGEAEHQAGTFMVKESALVDGEPSTLFLCIPCADRYLAFDDGDEDEDEEVINPHDYFCDGRKRPQDPRFKGAS